ncbi:MAG TPA: glycosyltransferase family 4 protein [Paracoccaceae bacterium]|nr:glycosyltransferase family 4 protein [Paracoccaceae bacterium]
MSRIAFYAPMKPPDDPTPSGDREVARLLLRALEAAGHAPAIVSRFRCRDLAGDPAAQSRLAAAASAELDRLLPACEADPPALWFTYHCYYKAPDLLGPATADRLGIPYVIAEPSHSPGRLHGPWAGFARASLAALRRADRLLWSTARDLPGLQAVARPGQLVHLPPFLDPGPPPPPRRLERPLRLLAVAMMREGDKLASYRALAEALRLLRGDWTLTIVGDGPARAEVEALFAELPARFLGRVDRRAALRAIYESHELFVWPGIGEAFGMVYLEAQAAGLPALAANHPGPAEILATRPLPEPGDAAAFAAAIEALAARPAAGAEARAHALARHSLDAAAATLGRVIAELVP